MSEEAPAYEAHPEADIQAGEIKHVIQMAPPDEPDLSELFTALAKAHLEIQNAERNVENDFLGSKYADLAACLEAVRKPLADNGIAVIQLPRPTESPGVIAIETMLCHTSGQYISSIIEMAPQKTDPQGIGSAMTYMRRYALSAMCAIAQVDDDAQGALKGKDEYERITAKAADEILVEASNLFGEDKADAVIDRMLSKVFSTSDMIIERVADLPLGSDEQALNLLRNQHKREQAQAKKSPEKKPKPAAKKPAKDADADAES